MPEGSKAGCAEGTGEKKEAAVKRRGGLDSPPQTVDKKLFSPRRGRIAISANERIAEFLDFVLQTKFAYVNKRRAGWTARLFAWLGGIFESFADGGGEDGKWDYGAIEM